MAFRNLMDSVKNFFGPNNSFFNGPRAEEEAAYNPAPAASDSGYYAQPQQQAAPQQNAAKPEQKLCFLGDGVERYRTAIESRLGQRAVFAPAQMCYLRPAAAAALAWENRESAVDYLTLQPHYLRAPQAERARAAKLAAEGKA